jgi:hypothetical protein
VKFILMCYWLLSQFQTPTLCLEWPICNDHSVITQTNQDFLEVALTLLLEEATMKQFPSHLCKGRQLWRCHKGTKLWRYSWKKTTVISSCNSYIKGSENWEESPVKDMKEDNCNDEPVNQEGRQLWW